MRIIELSFADADESLLDEVWAVNGQAPSG